MRRRRLGGAGAVAAVVVFGWVLLSAWILSLPLPEAARLSRFNPEKLSAPTGPDVSVAVHQLAAHRDVRELVEIGAYVPGTDPDADAAIARSGRIEAFLRQPMDQGGPTDQTWADLHALVAYARDHAPTDLPPA